MAGPAPGLEPDRDLAGLGEPDLDRVAEAGRPGWSAGTERLRAASASLIELIAIASSNSA